MFERRYIFKTIIFGIYVRFPGCKSNSSKSLGLLMPFYMEDCFLPKPPGPGGSWFDLCCATHSLQTTPFPHNPLPSRCFLEGASRHLSRSPSRGLSRVKSFGGVAFVDPELKKLAKKWGMQPSWTKIAALSLSLLLAVFFSKRKVLMKKHMLS